ncbi:hypothetical protein BpHYR1_030218 [Brachionus plicatilis]|uniref:Uncharacterized protein n=1 Tax=Brachionus plicatilis TaxID=10195 RepID=A0A3M7QR33_BRAPC|nr:hypothetical protein BpHYR1_030218 [Brachionus plicatilis]
MDMQSELKLAIKNLSTNLIKTRTKSIHNTFEYNKIDCRFTYVYCNKHEYNIRQFTVKRFCVKYKNYSLPILCVFNCDATGIVKSKNIVDLP